MPRERGNNRMPVVSVKMSDVLLNGLDELVMNGLYRNRSEAIRFAVRDLLRRELGDDFYRIVNGMRNKKGGDGDDK